MKGVLKRAGLGLALLLLGIVLSLSIAGALYAPSLEIPAGFAGAAMQVDGLSLRVLSEGTGRDVLFIHGSSGVLEDFAPQAAALAGSFRVTRYDRPGHGYSSAGPDVSFAYNARVARALIDKLELERVIVVGHSYGGATALALALLHSPRVSAYVVIDSAVYKPVRPVHPLYKYTALPLVGIGLLRALPRAAVEEKINAALRAEFVAGPPPAGFIALRSGLWSEPRIAHTLAREHRQSASELAMQSPRYGEIKAPVYFLSQKDSAARRENAELFKRAAPQTELTFVPRTGHYIQIEQPDVVTETIRRAASAP
jgi:pimeloyl-ACP methyl ester carboxylesterase